jgi:hypothetical protein
MNADGFKDILTVYPACLYTVGIHLPQPLLGHSRGWSVGYLLLQDTFEA